MKISIITVVYNNRETIKDAIESVLSQSYSDIEYIIIDGNSNDGTVEIIKEHSEKIAFFISENDKGIYDAMNKGIKVSTGDVIGILNSDDLYQDLTVIEAVMDQFIQDSEIDIVYGDLVYVKSDNTDHIVRKWKSETYYKRYFENGNVPPHPSLFVTSKVYKQAGVFETNYKLAADYELMLRIFKKHNFNSKYIDKVLVKMRLGGATNQSISNIIKQNKEILAAWKNNKLKTPLLIMPLRFLKRLIQFI